ncbi:hypothetical protein [Nocardia farcinica]|nr:hypothetical protein [Nocardia farcinica]
MDQLDIRQRNVFDPFIAGTGNWAAAQGIGTGGGDGLREHCGE